MTEKYYSEQQGLPTFEHKTGAWVTVAEVARIYGVSETAVRDWISDHIINAQDGKVNINRAIRELYEHQRALIEGKKGGARSRFDDARAELLELELQKKRGSLLDASEVEKEAFNIARSVRDRLQNIPSRIAAILAAKTDEREVRVILDGEIYEALVELSDPGKPFSKQSDESDPARRNHD